MALTKTPKIISVKEVIYIDSYTLQIIFNDASMQTIDFLPYLQKYPHLQYNKYQKLALFKKFYIDGGNLVWGKNWDLIFPIYQLYVGNILPKKASTKRNLKLKATH